MPAHYPFTIRRETHLDSGVRNRLVSLVDDTGGALAVWSERSERMLEKGYTIQMGALFPPDLQLGQHICRVHLLRWLQA